MTYDVIMRSVDIFGLGRLMTVRSQVNELISQGSSVTVSQLNQSVRHLLETKFDSIWVRGELSSFTPAASGHWYFTLKDDVATVRAVMFRQRALATAFNPQLGDAVEIRCKVTLYEARGEFQIQVEQMRKAGLGNLFEAFVALKEKLAAEGLFDAGNKRALNPYPRAVGVITSEAAAALHDVLSALARRAPHVSVIIYPAMVQGVQAPAQLRQALALANERAEVDSLLLVRGGGSLEDLWAFNDEALARDIAASLIPVVAGVGHETDFTIADFVADLRAPTPTAAAEMVCAPHAALFQRAYSVVSAMTRAQTRYLERAWQGLDRATARLISPAQRLLYQAGLLKNLNARMLASAGKLNYLFLARYDRAVDRLRHSLPQVDSRRLMLSRTVQALVVAQRRALVQKKAHLEGVLAQLRALSPSHTLARGYAIVMDQSGAVVRSRIDALGSQRLRITVANGSFDAQVLGEKPAASDLVSR